MITQRSHSDVGFLIPARFRQAHRDAIARLVADLSATIAALPTSATARAADDVSEFKAWASQIISDLPTLKQGDSDHGVA